MTNNIRKFIVLLTVLALGFLLMTPIANAQATKRRQRTASRKTSVPAKRTNKSTTPSLDEQAFAELMKVWLKRFTRCGDSYVGNGFFEINGVPEIMQYKGDIVMVRINLTEADMLNSVEYLAQPNFKWRLARSKSSGTWSPWIAARDVKPGHTPFGGWSYPYVRKMNGQWEVYWKVENSYMFEQWLENSPPPPCSVIQD